MESVMSSEKRKDSRGNVTIDPAGTMFFLRSSNGIYAITRVIDVSLSGAGIQTRYRLAPGEEVTLKFRSRDYRLEIRGTVAWCREDDDRSCKLGIAFDPGNRERNSLFFLAMRKYLDDFDGVYIDA
jgi:hypothetical protein